MPALSFQQKVMLANHYGIALCRGETEDGRRCFHYVLAERKDLERLSRDYDSGEALDFSSYGKIIYSGWGENPTPEEAALAKQLADEQNIA